MSALQNSNHSLALSIGDLKGTILTKELLFPQSRYDPDTLRFWPSEFRKAGYYNSMIGKWRTGLDDGAGRDWDYSAVWNHTRPDIYIYGGYYKIKIKKSVFGKISQGQVSERPVGGHDLVVTFFAAIGIKLPWKMHGHDISPMLLS